MSVPSRESWIWHLAEQAAERCQQLGSELVDLEMHIQDRNGALSVCVADVNLGGRRDPFIFAEGTLPDGGDAGELRRDLHAAIGKELARLRAPEPPPLYWFESLAGSLAVWTKRVGVDLASLQLTLDATEEGAVQIHLGDVDAVDVVTIPVPHGVADVNLQALARAVRVEAAMQDQSVRH